MFFNFLCVYIVLLLGTFCNGQSNTKQCSVCRVLVREAEWVIGQVDPKKSIQVGSFRVDPKGNQKIKEKQYARSEVHIEEVVELVCSKFGLYAEITFDDGTTQLVRTVGFDGKRLETKGFNLDRDKGNTFVYKCENLLEDHEEKIISLLQHENIDDYEKLICGDHLGLCSADDLLVPKFTLPEAQDEVDTINESDASDKEEVEREDNVSKDEGHDTAENESNELYDSPKVDTDEKTEL